MTTSAADDGHRRDVVASARRVLDETATADDDPRTVGRLRGALAALLDDIARRERS